MIIQCDWCGKETSKRPSYLKINNFCSKNCAAEYLTEKRAKTKNCMICGEKLKKGEGYATEASRGKLKDYVCDVCRPMKKEAIKKKKDVANKKKLLTKEIEGEVRKWNVCDWCDKIYRRGEGDSTRNFCSEKCRSEKQAEGWRRNRRKQKQKISVNIHDRISSNIYSCIKRQTKNFRRWEDILGYSVKDLMKHLERKFKPGMSWNNIGEWEIDHIIPKSAFNFETPDDADFQRCWALSNLQPLWEKENMVKGNRHDKPFQPSLLIEIKVTPKTDQC